MSSDDVSQPCDEMEDSNSAGDSETWNSDTDEEDEQSSESGAAAAAPESSGSDAGSAAVDSAGVSGASRVILEQTNAADAPTAMSAATVNDAAAKEPEPETRFSGESKGAATTLEQASGSDGSLSSGGSERGIPPLDEPQSALHDASSIGSVSANAGAPAAAVPSPALAPASSPSSSSSSSATLAMLLSPASLPSAAHRGNNLLQQQQQLQDQQHAQQSSADPVLLEGVVNSLQLHAAAPPAHAPGPMSHGATAAFGAAGWPSAMMHFAPHQQQQQQQLSPEQQLQQHTLPLTERNLALHTAAAAAAAGLTSEEDDSGHDYHACIDEDCSEDEDEDGYRRGRARSCSCSCSDSGDTDSDCSCVCSLGADCLCCQNEPGEEGDASMCLLEANEALMEILQPASTAAGGGGFGPAAFSAQLALYAATFILPRVLPPFYKLLGLNWATVPPLMFRSLEQ